MNSPKIGPYAEKATLLNMMYAFKHKYSFVVETCPRREDMAKDYMWDEENQYLFVWSKATMVRRHLPHYDYLLFIDSDAYFENTDYSVGEFVSRYVDGDTCIVAAEDCKSADKCYVADGLNTGVMLFKNCAKTMAILDEWIDAPNNAKCEKWKYVHPREQACLNELMKHHGSAIRVVKVFDMSFGTDGTWVRHMMSTPGNERNSTFRDVMKRRLPEVIESFASPQASEQHQQQHVNSLCCALLALVGIVLLAFWCITL